MWIGKKHGGSGVGPHWWDADGSAVEVPEPLARDLLSHPSGEFFKADPPKPAAKPAAKADPDAKAEATAAAK